MLPTNGSEWLPVLSTGLLLPPFIAMTFAYLPDCFWYHFRHALRTNSLWGLAAPVVAVMAQTLIQPSGIVAWLAPFSFLIAFLSVSLGQAIWQTNRIRRHGQRENEKLHNECRDSLRFLLQSPSILLGHLRSSEQNTSVALQARRQVEAFYGCLLTPPGEVVFWRDSCSPPRATHLTDGGLYQLRGEAEKQLEILLEIENWRTDPFHRWRQMNARK